VREESQGQRDEKDRKKEKEEKQSLTASMNKMFSSEYFNAAKVLRSLK